MGLSKDTIDVIEEIKNLELTAAQKRRLRRKKLKAARAESLDEDNNTEKVVLELNTNKNKGFVNNKEHLPNKKQKHKCDSQVLDRPEELIPKDNSNNKQKSKSEKQILSNNLKSTTQCAVSDVKIKSKRKSTKSEGLKSDCLLVTNQNKSPQLEKSCSITEKTKDSKKELPCKDLDLKEKQPSKINGHHQIQSENLDLIENKKKKSDKSVFTENHTNKSSKLNLKQAVVSEACKDTESQESKDLKKSVAHVPSDKDLVVIEEQKTKSVKSKTEGTKSGNLKIEKQEPTPQKIECPQNIPHIFIEENMGKMQDISDAQKQQEGLPKMEIKKGDTASADATAKSREDIKAAREAKKLAKQKAKRKDDSLVEDTEGKADSPKLAIPVAQVKNNTDKNHEVSVNKMENTKTVELVSDLKYKENIPPTDTRKAENEVNKSLGEVSKGDINKESAEKSDDSNKSKAELRAERRAKQEAQRAAKQEMQSAATPAAEQKLLPDPKDKEPVKTKEEKSLKAKSADKSKSKAQSMQKVGWFQHLYVEKNKESLKNIPINSNLHPAVVKLGVQLAERVITGSNARCIALLDAIKKMVRDYSLPARTEFGRGLQPQLAAAAAFLQARRAPSAAETNALKHFRRQLTQLPANVDEFDAKKQLQEEIDRYIREQIDMAGEAISLILRNKISPGDHVLTYGCSSLIERVLCSAWAAGVRFRATVAGARGQRGPDMLRRLRARGVPASYVDISAISYVMADVQKVLLGAGALLAHGAALGAAGGALVALVARARNVPVLVACETHKFSERTHLDPLVAHEIGDPDELIDRTDPNSPLKDWRSNGNLTLLNVTYDVTPPSLITAVVTELGILPCTSAPVVLRFKQSEYGM